MIRGNKWASAEFERNSRNGDTDGSWHINSLRPSDAYMRQWTNHHWFRKWLVAWSAASHYLNQCWNIVNWAIGNKLQWNLKQNSYIFIQENAFENVVWKMAAILSRPQYVNSILQSRSGYGYRRFQWTKAKVGYLIVSRRDLCALLVIYFGLSGVYLMVKGYSHLLQLPTHFGIVLNVQFKRQGQLDINDGDNPYCSGLICFYSQRFGCISLVPVSRSWDRLMCIIWIPILVRRHLYSQAAPWKEK